MKWRTKILSVILAGALLVGSMPGNIGPLPVQAANAAFAGEEWYDQIDVVERNREPAHAYFTPYESAQKALANEKSVLDDDAEESAWKLSLNGTWKFKFAQKPAEREKQVTGEAAADYVENWDTADWDDIKVPSSIQAIKNEDGSFKYEKPIYVNQRYPWQNYETVSLGEHVTAPTVRNSVGQYKRTFTIPENWDGREVFLSFEGVESAFYLYVNGRQVGYAEDSYTTDEFNITEYLKEGENTLAVEVYRWSTGSYLENQDFIRYSGIFRDVNLYSKAKVELRDLFVKTDLDAEYEDAVLTLDATVRNLGQKDAAGKQYQVKADLYEMDGTTKVWQEPLTIKVNVPAAKETAWEKADDEGLTVTGSKEVSNPRKWFADSPNLYMLLIELQDEKGNTVETACQRVGFREIDKVDINEEGQEQMQINGEKIMFRGTNRHESDLDDGRALTKEDIQEDLRLMKQFNVNAIRTSHYPNNPYMYALADELGIYICDEVNAESHKGATDSDIPSGYPIWNNSILDRTKNMVERDKNHPSVVIWSLGNEATYKTYTMDENYCFYNSTRWILQRDPSRLRKYERDNRYTKGDRENSMVDIYSSQYWGVSSVESHVANTSNKAPYIQSEYAHAMGNALGNFKEYWDVFRSYPNAQGGFIWDWIDQSMRTKVEDAERFVWKITDPCTKNTVDFNENVTEGQNDTWAVKGIYMPAGSGKLAANSTDDQGMTVDVWLKPEENYTVAQQTFVSRGDNNGYNLQINAQGELEFYVNGWSGGVVTADVPANFTDGNWHRLTGIYAGGNYKLYFDGKQIGTGTRAKVSACDDFANTTDITIGTNATYTSRKFNGYIDRAAVIKRALTADEIASTGGSLETVAADVVYAVSFAKDQLRKESSGITAEDYFGYGGDWGETVTDNDFCCNGLVFADRTPSPELYEVKKVHQEISFYDDGKAAEGEVRIVNEFLNTNLNKYDVFWTLKKDNSLLAKGALSEEEKELAAQQEKTVRLAGFPKIQAAEGSDYVLTLSVTLKEDQAWAGDYSGHAGDEIAFEEFELCYEARERRPVLQAAAMEKLRVQEAEDAVTVSGTTAKENGKPFEVVIDKATGYISSYRVDGQTILKDGPVPNYYRAPVSNDPGFSQGMKTAAENFVIDEEGITVSAKDKVVTIHVPGTISGLDSPEILDYTIYGNGQIVVNNRFTPGGSVGNIARIGMKMTVPEGYENLTYYGNGPQENYADRNTGTKLGVYTSTVDAQFEEKYVKPQENGNRTGVRWTALTNEEGTGILVSSDSEMEAGALHYRAEDLAAYRHPYQVPKLRDTILTVDLVQRGLGNASCGPGPLGSYIIQSGVTYNQTFSIQPITAKADEAELMAKSRVDMNSGAALSGIKVAGQEISGFLANQTEYNCTVMQGSFAGDIPQVEAVKMSEDTEVTVTQATKVPGTAVIHAVSPFGIEAEYQIYIQVVDKLYLSDMDWTVDKGGYYANARNMCGCGAEMAVYVDGEKKTYEKGIGSHAPAEVAVDLTGKGVDLFEAQIGISACQPKGNPANVNFVVKADGTEIFRKDAVRSGESYPVRLNISGVKTLSLITETNGADSNDHALWADARLSKREALPVSGIAVAETEKTLYLREEYQIRASVEPEDTTDEKTLTYTSSNPEIVTVDASGKATAVAEGTAVITVASTARPQIRAEVAITVRKEVSYDELLRQLREKESALADAQKSLKEKETALLAEQGKLEKVQEELAAAQKQADATERLLDEAREDAAGLEKRLADEQAKVAALEQEKEELEGRILGLEKALAEERQKTDALEQEKKTLEAQVADAKAEAEQAKQEAAAAKKELELLKQNQTDQLKTGDKEEQKHVIYRVTDAAKKEAQAYGVLRADIRTVTIADTVTVSGVECKVTSIAPNAFKALTRLKKVVIGKNVVTIGKKAFCGDKNLRSIQVKGTALKKVGKAALKGIHAKAVIKTPKSKKKAYKKIFRSKGQKKTVRVK